MLDVFEAWGYARLITPVFECADVLELGLGHGAKAQAIRFVEPGTGEVVALRPDITPQVARIVATRLADVEPPIRLCYEGAVMRLAGEMGQREVLQAGIELIGSDDDAEVLAIAAATLAATDLPETRLDVGHVALARHVLDTSPDRDRVAAAIARKDRRALRDQPLAEALCTLWGPAEPTLERARALPWPADVRASLDRLTDVLAKFQQLADPPVAPVTIDLGDLRGFDYYTGVRFAGYAGGAPDAVLRGGRYDELIGRYGRPHRATGFAVDLEALAQAQRAVGLAPPAQKRGYAVFGPNAARVARELRANGNRAVVCSERPTESWLRGAGLDEVIEAGGA